MSLRTRGLLAAGASVAVIALPACVYAAASVTADHISGYDSTVIKDPNQTNTFLAVSYQFSPVNVGANVTTAYKENDSDGGTYTNTPKKVEKGQIKVGNRGHGTPVQIKNRPKPSVGGIFNQLISSDSGLYHGEAGSLYSIGIDLGKIKTPAGVGLFANGTIKDGEKRQGEAAGEADDPMVVDSSSPYAPRVDAIFKFDDDTEVGGVHHYATDSAVNPSLTSYLAGDDGVLSSASSYLWDLDVEGDASTGVYTFSFNLNPDALSKGEIILPSTFLTAQGWSSLSPADLATAFNAYEVARATAGFGYDSSDGSMSLPDFAVFPSGTMFVPYGGSVTFADGVNAYIVSVPEPRSAVFLTPVMVGMLRRSRR